jgi:hypothetical protein
MPCGSGARGSEGLSCVKRPPVYRWRSQQKRATCGATALFVLLVATVLAIYKPRGMTPYGWRKQHG